MDDELRRGEDISTALLQAIEESKISIVVLSENYASSKWCLDELVKILDCKESKQQLVRPVFFKVDPSDIRNHRGSFGEALAYLEYKFKDNMEKVQKWKAALTEAANLSGWTLSDQCSESSAIEKIIEEISEQVINSTYLDVAKYPVGMRARVQEIHKLLGAPGRDVHMLGIWGVGGIGKTTVARAVFNSIAHKFDGCCFLEDVRENSKGARGLVKLQKILLCEILRGTKLEVANVARGITMIKERLQYRSVLLVLDDVNGMDQLDNLAGQCSWFGKGSKIIITTRDKQLLRGHSVDLIYEVQGLARGEALELFCMNAFNRCRPLDGYAELTELAVRYAQGLPLALVVLGSSLCNENVELWEAALDGFKSSKIQDVLEISYNGLDDRGKEAFLDISCFFKGENRECVTKTLEACGSKRYVINVLIEKSLISIRSGGDIIWMHDLLEEMGKDIVHRQSPNDPGKRSRLWFHEDVYRVLTDNTGTNNVRGIKVKLPEHSGVVCFSGTTFSNMRNLRLFIYRAGSYSGVVDNMPDSLRVVDWPDCRLQVLSSNLPRELALLNMPRSRITVLGNGLKHLKYLTSINLRDCQYLTKVSDLSGVPNLQCLDLAGCKNLVEVNPSVGFLDELIYLILWNCPRLEAFPTEVSWKSMREVQLGYCPRLKNFINIVHKMESIRELNLYGSGIKELRSWIGYCTSLEVLNLLGTPVRQLPSTIGYLTSLVKLEVSETLIEELPSTIENLTSLRDLKLSETLLKRFPSSIGSLTSLVKLDASETLIEELPSSIGCLTSLRQFNLSKTPLKGFPSSMGCLTSLEELDASETLIEELPPSIGDLTSLRELNLSTTSIKELPSSIGNLTSLFQLNVSKTPIKELASSIGCLTSLLKLDASETLIEELPLSFRYLIRLQHLKLKGCANLTNVSHSVYGGLQHLEGLDLSWCPKLVTFPRMMSTLVSSSAESLPLMLQNNSNNGHDDCGRLLFPQLGCLRFEECKLSVSDFLSDLDCVSTLEILNLSGSSFDSLPACICKFRMLYILDLGGCKKLRDISELPPNIECINLDNCVSLERFSKLSNVLQQKDTLGLLWRMHLSNCLILVENLGIDLVSKMAKALLNQVFHLSRYVYVDDCYIILPSLQGIEVPKWFDSGKVDIIVLPGHETKSDICQLLIKIPRSLKGKRIGLVVCVVFEITQNFSAGSCGCTATFVIDNVRHAGKKRIYFDSKGELLAHSNVCVCLSCIDFKELKVVDVVRVIFRMSKSDAPGLVLKSFGIHLAMQETDDDHISGEDLALERYRPIDASISDFDNEEGAAVASIESDDSNSGEVHDDHHYVEQGQDHESHRPPKRFEYLAIGRAMLAFLRCFGITCL